jgi:MFS family permease
MGIALIATIVLVQPTPRPARRTSIAAPIKALRHRGPLTMGLTALCCNWGFTVLGYAPFPLHLGAHELGYVFTGWGVLVAIFAVNNTITTQAVMTVSPVERPLASAAYGFVRYIGGGLAPFAAGKIAEHSNVHVPFYIGAAAIALGIVVLARPQPAERRRTRPGGRERRGARGRGGPGRGTRLHDLTPQPAEASSRSTSARPSRAHWTSTRARSTRPR